MKTANIHIEFEIDYDPKQESELRKKVNEACDAFETFGFRLRDLHSTPIKLSALSRPNDSTMTSARRRELLAAAGLK